MNLVDMRASTALQRSAAARILLDALAHVPSAWKTRSDALDEVATFVVDDERLAVLAIDDSAKVCGWIGAIKHTQFGWELHPMVVDPKHQRQGIGRQLINALEEKARAAGVLTIWLGTDDDFGGTNLYGRNLFPNVLEQLQQIHPAAGHPFTFYQHVGYTITGIFPDVDGAGKHDILMAKRLV